MLTEAFNISKGYTDLTHRRLILPIGIHGVTCYPYQAIMALYRAIKVESKPNYQLFWSTKTSYYYVNWEGGRADNYTVLEVDANNLGWWKNQSTCKLSTVERLAGLRYTLPEVKAYGGVSLDALWKPDLTNLDEQVTLVRTGTFESTKLTARQLKTFADEVCSGDEMIVDTVINNMQIHMSILSAHKIKDLFGK